MLRRLILFTLVCVALLPIVSIAAAQDAPQCDGMLKALAHIPPNSPGYAKVLAKGQEDCGEAIDHAALLALYDSTAGPNWATKWDVTTNDNYCGWYGVVCNGEGLVQYLNLYTNNLNGTLPPELGNLSALEVLNLGDNQLSGSIPSTLQRLNHLQGLHLHQNQLSGPIPAELGNLTALELLNLGENQLSGSIPPALGNLTDLEQLHLHQNQLNGPIPPALGNLTALELLNLGENQLSGSIPSALSNLSSLSYLNLVSNPLSCWETTVVLQWALGLSEHYWDYPTPGVTVCP